MTDQGDACGEKIHRWENGSYTTLKGEIDCRKYSTDGLYRIRVGILGKWPEVEEVVRVKFIEILYGRRELALQAPQPVVSEMLYLVLHSKANHCSRGGKFEYSVRTKQVPARIRTE